MKHIKKYSDSILESMGKGSVVLIKGKSDSDRKRLYAAHVAGTAELKPGAKMLFLSEPFYRIVQDNDKLKALKISYQSEKQLKSALNLKSDGKISVVQNNSKTPHHWKTAKHQTVQSALKELEEDLLNSSSYLLESEQSSPSREQVWADFWNEVVSDTIKSIFYGEKAIDVLNYTITPTEIVDQAMESAEELEDSTAAVEWELEVDVLCRNKKYQAALEYFNLEPSVNLIVYLQSTVTFHFTYDRGDYWTPPSQDVDVTRLDTEILDIMVEGDDSTATPETAKLINDSGKLIEKMDDAELSDFIKRNTKNQILLR